jgi:hypothetical protein
MNNNITKLRREKAPNEGYNFLRFLENYTLRELQTFTLRQLLDLDERPNIARRETQS